MKPTLSEMENTVSGINNRLYISEGKIRDLEGKTIETIRNETQRKTNEKKKKPMALVNCGTISSDQIHYNWNHQRRNEGNQKIMPGKLLNLMKTANRAKKQNETKFQAQ